MINTVKSRVLAVFFLIGCNCYTKSLFSRANILALQAAKKTKGYLLLAKNAI